MFTADNVQCALLQEWKHVDFLVTFASFLQLLAQDLGVLVEDVEEIIQNLEMKSRRQKATTLLPSVVCLKFTSLSG